MNNHKKIIFFCFIFLPSFIWGHFTLKIPFVSAENGSGSFFFNKNLKIGDRNEDVRNLQKILNKNSATEVSAYGSGSSGDETDFFGALTKNAIIKFQELYGLDILVPLGLKKGTGFVGIATRLKLNSLIGENALGNQSNYEAKRPPPSSSARFESQSSSSSSQLMTQSASSENNNSSSSSENSSTALFSKSPFEAPGVRVYNTSEYQMKPGDLISVTGEGFASTGNIVHIGESRSISDIKTDSSSSFSFIIPKDLPTGKYDIWVENENGISKSETIKIYIAVTNNPTERPAVEKVEPKEATIDDEITISGKGFTASGNSIYSMFGNIMNISSSDGKTLRFKPSLMAQMANLRNNKNLKNIPVEISFYIVNDNGYNKEPASFLINF